MEPFASIRAACNNTSFRTQRVVSSPIPTGPLVGWDGPSIMLNPSDPGYIPPVSSGAAVTGAGRGGADQVGEQRGRVLALLAALVGRRRERRAAVSTHERVALQPIAGYCLGVIWRGAGEDPRPDAGEQ